METRQYLSERGVEASESRGKKPVKRVTGLHKSRDGAGEGAREGAGKGAGKGSGKGREREPCLL